MKIRPSLVVGGLAAIALLALLLWRSAPRDTASAQAPSSPGSTRASHVEQALIDDLVLANRILASDAVGFVDAYGHVSVRSRQNPDRYFISRYVSPGSVTAE